jgi:hypothetical protein
MRIIYSSRPTILFRELSLFHVMLQKPERPVLQRQLERQTTLLFRPTLAENGHHDDLLLIKLIQLQRVGHTRYMNRPHLYRYLVVEREGRTNRISSCNDKNSACPKHSFERWEVLSKTIQS